MLTPYQPPKPPLALAPAPAKAVIPHHPRPPPPPFQLLEVTIISAQDLSPAARTVPTYAVAWVHPAHKLTTRVDHVGRVDPTWNDKFVFRVDEDFLRSDTSAVMIQIYGSCRFRPDPLIGTVRLVLSAINPSSATQFVALQVRRPSLRPQGILNVGVALLDGYIRSMPLYSTVDASAFAYKDLMGGAAGRQDRISVDGDPDRISVGKAEAVMSRTGSVVVKRWAPTAVETKLEKWRTELPEPRRSVDLDPDDEIRISERKAVAAAESGSRRRRRRSWSTGALSCFCEVRRHRE